MFGLSKEEMANEPLEDIIINEHIKAFYDEKRHQEIEKEKRRSENAYRR